MMYKVLMPVPFLNAVTQDDIDHVKLIDKVVRSTEP